METSAVALEYELIWILVANPSLYDNMYNRHMSVYLINRAKQKLLSASETIIRQLISSPYSGKP